MIPVSSTHWGLLVLHFYQWYSQLTAHTCTCRDHQPTSPLTCAFFFFQMKPKREKRKHNEVREFMWYQHVRQVKVFLCLLNTADWRKNKAQCQIERWEYDNWFYSSEYLKLPVWLLCWEKHKERGCCLIGWEEYLHINCAVRKLPDSS